MEIELVKGETSHPATLPYDGASFVEVDRWRCECGSVRVQGGATRHDFETYYARAFCAECRAQARSPRHRHRLILSGSQEASLPR